MNYLALLAIIGCIAAAWYAWRYYKLRREIDEYAGRARELHVDSRVKELQNLSSALTSIIKAFDLRHSTLESERARLATVLDQITDGVLIADADGTIQFANPAAGRLFQTPSPINRSIAEVVRHHQLRQPHGREGRGLAVDPVVILVDVYNQVRRLEAAMETYLGIINRGVIIHVTHRGARHVSRHHHSHG